MHHTPEDKHEGAVYSAINSYYETMSVEVHRKLADTLAAAEAQKRRKELKKLKSINGGQGKLAKPNHPKTQIGFLARPGYREVRPPPHRRRLPPPLPPPPSKPQFILLVAMANVDL
ncbi:hypothetical protein QJS10_CPB13g01634 [Acorus calamus]|uniref:Uncharacterized protein n=1 Tax=Acorus calamus TaxID=4465 RepID=A0AAV9DHL5_ACOCL|nr:hypothetical protein QJS10_CPB13g01634 [Acorus calamus]